jgi:hypothetical protein
MEFPERKRIFSLAREVGEGRGEGPTKEPPHPDPLPHEDVVEREILMWMQDKLVIDYQIALRISAAHST